MSDQSKPVTIDGIQTKLFMAGRESMRLEIDSKGRHIQLPIKAQIEPSVLAINKIVMDIIGEKVPHSSTHNSDYPYTKGYGEACYCDLSPTNNRINKQLATAHQYGLGE